MTVDPGILYLVQCASLIAPYALLTVDGFTVRLAYSQILIVVVTVTLMTGFTWLITKTSFGRQQPVAHRMR
jgi:branched-chain amino acid transport system permease protein